jgi:hypothetical protein
MFALIVRNRSFRSLPLLLFKGVLFSFAVLGAYNIVYLYKHSTSLTLEVCTVWAILSLYLALGKPSYRCTPLDMTLPIPSHRLWLAHYASVLLSGFLMMLLSGTILVVGSQLLFHHAGDAPLSGRNLLSAAPHLLAVWLLVVTILQGLNPTLFRIPGTRRNRLLMATCIAGSLILLILIVPHSAVIALIPFIIALALTYRNYKSVPTAYSILPLKANGTGIAAAEIQEIKIERHYSDRALLPDQISGSFDNRRLLLTTVFRCFMKIEGFVKIPGTTFIVMVFLIVWGMLLSGFFTIWKGWDEDLRFTFIFITAYVLFSGFRKQLMQIFKLDSLPIPRRTLFAGLVTPLLLALMIGYGAGLIGITFLDKNKQIIEYLDCDGRYCIRVPYEFCQISWDGLPPDNTSPWGETHEAWMKPLFTGRRIALYSPFATYEGSSADFAALQISRAVESIYGKSIPADEIKSNYFEIEGDSVIGLKGSGLTLFEDYPDLKRRGDGPFFPIFFLLMGWVWMLLMIIYLKLFRPGTSERTRVIVYIALMVIAFALHFAPFAFAIAGWLNMGAAIGFFAILIRNASNVFPGSSILIWVICALLFLLSYRIAQKQFDRAEFLYTRETKND